MIQWVWNVTLKWPVQQEAVIKTNPRIHHWTIINLRGAKFFSIAIYFLIQFGNNGLFLFPPPLCTHLKFDIVGFVLQQQQQLVGAERLIASRWCCCPQDKWILIFCRERVGQVLNTEVGFSPATKSDALKIDELKKAVFCLLFSNFFLH